MLSANFAVDPSAHFLGSLPEDAYPLLARPPPGPRHALSLVEAGTYGNRMAKHLHLASAPMISVRTRRKAHLAVTRLRSETGLR